MFLGGEYPGENLDNTVRMTISQSMPIDLDAHKIDYKVLKEIKDDGVPKVKVFVTAVLKNIIKSYIDILVELGLKPISVDIPANSAAKFFNRDIITTESDTWFKRNKYSKLDQSTFAVIDFGSETTIVNILKDRVLEFNKVILKGSSNIDEAIAESNHVKLDEAERLKKIQGLTPLDLSFDEEQVKIHNSIKGVINEIVRQIFQCFEFYEKDVLEIRWGKYI